MQLAIQPFGSRGHHSHAVAYAQIVSDGIYKRGGRDVVSS